MQTVMRSILVFALLVGLGRAEVLQLRARAADRALPEGWDLGYWELAVSGDRVELLLEAEREPCPEEECYGVYRYRLPGTVRLEAGQVRWTPRRGPVRPLGRLEVTRVEGRDFPQVRLAPGVDVRWDQQGVFLLVDTAAEAAPRP